MSSNRLSKLTVAGALLVSAGAIVGANLASGAGESAESIFVSITPCRLIDTRPDTPSNPNINVGPRNTKIGEDETVLFTAWGTGDADSPCEIPNSATAIATNTVAIAPSARSFMTLYPGDVDNPGTANLNYVAGQAPTPNSANVPLSPTGTFNVFNAFGDVHVVIDINGYYQPATSVAPDGDPGPRGDGGTPGVQGPDGAPGAVPETNRMPLDDILEERWDRDPGRGAVFPISSFGFASDGDHVYAADLGITKIDRDTNEVVATLALGDRYLDAAVVGQRLYAPNRNGNLDVFDITSDALITSIPIGTQPGVITAVGDLLYVENEFTEIVVVDASTNTVIDRFESGATGFVREFESHDGRMFVPTAGSDITVIDLADNTVIDANGASPGESIAVAGGGTVNVTVVGDEIWASNAGGSSVSVFDAYTFEPIGAPISVGPDAESIVFDGRHVAVQRPGAITIIDARTRSVTGSIPVDGSGFIGYFDGRNMWFRVDNSTVKFPAL